MPLNALNVEKKMVETLRKESVYGWEKLDLGKTKGSHLKRPNPNNEQSFI